VLAKYKIKIISAPNLILHLFALLGLQLVVLLPKSLVQNSTDVFEHPNRRASHKPILKQNKPCEYFAHNQLKKKSTHLYSMGPVTGGFGCVA